PRDVRPQTLPQTLSESPKRTGDAHAASTEQQKMAVFKWALDALPKGNIVVDAPKEMKVSDKRTVNARVGVDVPRQLLISLIGRTLSHGTQSIEQALERGTQILESDIKISSSMIATLNGPGFDIRAVTPEQQNIAAGYPTVWTWNIEAKDAGEQK